MKQKTTVTLCALMTLFYSNHGAAVESPSNSLQVEYQNSEASHTGINMDTLYHIPTATYHYLDTVFTSFYNKLTFKTNIANSTFENSAHHELLAIPLIAENKQGLQLELFGHFSDPSTQNLSNISQDQALYHYFSSTEYFDFYESNFSIGAGISFNTGKNSKVKVLISNKQMPGYGTSNALLGFETSF